MQSTTILVTGATGKTGSRISKLLKDSGHTVRPGSRRASIPFDWQDTDTWQAALCDVQVILTVAPLGT